jgi:hypothetical protein
MLELEDGSVASIDAEDLPRVARLQWHVERAGLARYPATIYCGCGTTCETIFLHRLIANAGPDDIVLHRNRDTLDNRRENLVVIGRRTLAALAASHSLDAIATD